LQYCDDSTGISHTEDGARLLGLRKDAELRISALSDAPAKAAAVKRTTRKRNQGGVRSSVVDVGTCRPLGVGSHQVPVIDIHGYTEQGSCRSLPKVLGFQISGAGLNSTLPDLGVTGFIRRLTEIDRFPISSAQKVHAVNELAVGIICYHARMTWYNRELTEKLEVMLRQAVRRWFRTPTIPNTFIHAPMARHCGGMGLASLERVCEIQWLDTLIHGLTSYDHRVRRAAWTPLLHAVSRKELMVPERIRIDDHGLWIHSHTEWRMSHHAPDWYLRTIMWCVKSLGDGISIQATGVGPRHPVSIFVQNVQTPPIP
jgi:hypothetical protein